MFRIRLGRIRHPVKGIPDDISRVVLSAVGPDFAHRQIRRFDIVGKLSLCAVRNIVAYFAGADRHGNAIVAGKGGAVGRSCLCHHVGTGGQSFQLDGFRLSARHCDLNGPGLLAGRGRIRNARDCECVDPVHKAGQITGRRPTVHRYSLCDLERPLHHVADFQRIRRQRPVLRGHVLVLADDELLLAVQFDGRGGRLRSTGLLDLLDVIVVAVAFPIGCGKSSLLQGRAPLPVIGLVQGHGFRKGRVIHILLVAIRMGGRVAVVDGSLFGFAFARLAARLVIIPAVTGCFKGRRLHHHAGRSRSIVSN